MLFGPVLYCKKHEGLPGFRRKSWPWRPAVTALRTSLSGCSPQGRSCFETGLAPLPLSARGGSKMTKCVLLLCLSSSKYDVFVAVDQHLPAERLSKRIIVTPANPSNVTLQATPGAAFGILRCSILKFSARSARHGLTFMSPYMSLLRQGNVHPKPDGNPEVFRTMLAQPGVGAGRRGHVTRQPALLKEKSSVEKSTKKGGSSSAALILNWIN